jgi:hypothetical protein
LVLRLMAFHHRILDQTEEADWNSKGTEEVVGTRACTMESVFSITSYVPLQGCCILNTG